METSVQLHQDKKKIDELLKQRKAIENELKVIPQQDAELHAKNLRMLKIVNRTKKQCNCTPVLHWGLTTNPY